MEPVDRPARVRPPQPRPKAGSKRQRLLQETTHTLTKTDNHNHCESCHATVSQDRLNVWVQQGQCPAMLEASLPVAIGRIARVARSPSWTTSARGFVRLVGTSRAYVHSSSPNPAHASFPKRAGATWPPCRTERNWNSGTGIGLTSYRPRFEPQLEPPRNAAVGLRLAPFERT